MMFSNRRHMRKQIELLEDDADLLAGLVELPFRHRRELAGCAALVADELAINENLAGIIRLEKVDAAKQRALARAARSNDADHLPARHRETEVPEHLMGAVTLVQVLDLDGRNHAGPVTVAAPQATLNSRSLARFAEPTDLRALAICRRRRACRAPDRSRR